MNTLLETDFIKRLTTDAKLEIQKNAAYLVPIFEHIVKYVKTHKLIIGDIKLLEGTFVYWDYVHIYTNDSPGIANGLMRDLCETFKDKLMMRATEWTNQFTIEYDYRGICNVYSLDGMGYNVEEAIKRTPTIINDLYMIPPILEIINAYGKLYNPKYIETWEEIHHTIKALEGLIERKTLTPSVLKASKEAKKPSTIGKLSEIMIGYCTDTDFVLVGETAYEYLNIIKSSSDQPIEIISKNDIEFDYKAINTYINRFTKTGIVYNTDPIMIPDEPILKRYHFYAMLNNKRKHFLTIYNNTSYELISYSSLKIDNGELKLADPILQLRLLYMKIWECYVSGKSCSSDIFDIIDFYRERINITEIKPVIGIYIDPIVKRKMLNIENPNTGKYTFYCDSVV
jgi:hypothetical protein